MPRRSIRAPSRTYWNGPNTTVSVVFATSARVKAAACVDEDARYERIRASRSLRAWTDDGGAGRIDIRGPIDATAKVLAAIAPFERDLFDEARADGRRERHDALAFDALVALAEAPVGEGEGAVDKVRGTTGVVRIDHARAGAWLHRAG